MNKELSLKGRTEELPLQFSHLLVRIPGSSANLGPGFDVLGLAYQLYCTLEFSLLEKGDDSLPLITLKGDKLDSLATDKSNLIYSVLANVCRDKPELLERVRISIESEIPLGRGLGSSAAAITGAAWAAYALKTSALASGDSVLSKACEIEGHADNAAASLLGGLIVCANRTRTAGVHTQRSKWPEDWATVVFVPPYVLSTKKSRSVLPQSYSKQDAVHNLQKVSLLLAAVQNHDEDAMREALFDRLHEPYRAELVPELAAIKKVTGDLPVIGCTLSGAGPSVLTIVHESYRRQLIECLGDWAKNQCPEGQVLDLRVDQEGLKYACD